MKYIIVLIGILYFSSCSDSEPSQCIEESIALFKKENIGSANKYILTFEQKGKTYYIFDYGIAFDATAQVVDNDCKIVCIYGGFRLATDRPCDNYQEGISNAVQIWPD